MNPEAPHVVWTNIPITQVIIAGCALLTVLAGIVSYIYQLVTNVNLMMTNHLPHLEAKIDLVLDALGIPHVSIFPQNKEKK